MFERTRKRISRRQARTFTRRVDAALNEKQVRALRTPRTGQEK